MRKSVLLLATALVAVLFAAPGAGAQTPEEEGELTTLSVDSDQVTDRVGLVDPTTGIWHIRGAGGAVNSFFYGNPGDFPMAGDWDCDGIATPGLYRQSDGFVYLRNSNTQGIANIRFFFGNPSDIPLAGDFNGDGCDTVSIYRPSEQRIYIINELGANDGGLGAADFNYVFGNPGDKPFVGDFNGDGIDTIGLHRESTGFVYFRQSHTQGVANAEFFFGDPGDRLVAGDWGVVDDVDSPAIFRPSVSRFYFRYTNTQGNANEEIQMGSFQMLPVAGSWTVKLGLAGVLPKAVVDLPYSATLKPVGGSAPYTITKTSGPAWVSVNNSGRFSGTPPTVGSFNVGITVTDSKGLSINQIVPLTVQDGCDTNNQIPNAECLALVALYKATGGRNWIEDTNWFTTPPCSWFGVTCAGGHVTELVLEGTANNGNNLNGSIPTSIGALTFLTRFNLQHNSGLIGAIPTQISTMIRLQVFDVSGTGVSGPIPNSFGSMAALAEVEIDETGVTGGIPATLLNRPLLQVLDLANNSVTFGGALPSFAGLPAIQVIDLSENAFTGAIHTSLVSRGTLVELNLSQNALTGTIPAFGTTAMPGLVQLDLATNQLSGEIPSQIASLPGALELTFCGQTGPTTLTIGGVTIPRPVPDPNEALFTFVNTRDSTWHTACA